MLVSMTTQKQFTSYSFYFFFVIATLAMLVAGCGQVTPGAFPTSMQTVQVAVTSTPTSIVSFTADPNQLRRWREYEQALAGKLLSYLPPDEVLCEWEILGESGQEVYVWAFCLGLPPVGRDEKYAPGASIPAVIHLESNGSVQSVELPRDDGLSYAEGIRKIFPKDVQEKIFGRLVNIAGMVTHAQLRRETPEPPLIILLATPHP